MSNRDRDLADWEKIAILLVCSGVACGGAAASLYAIAFLLMALHL